ncbi:uncharacterized protein RHIMIDRAFT_93001 [Rhizopus microsporus ATCC 52813]|uniref:SWIM-type domain-containing protein n=1 Tax=Rhizopus microsporus ATCC 52813 TaxID=1340429 RepID=A0A2G4T528_RHIZD|nr:uncharacterized protein RHIMIDRAFT_93001 [Rhizopus microsporus ATCC 52813]PHZ15776.1 hypothetical protein RHIMIDRAFT_93001 [Rhizopus microsporus ATCC 52813]
MSYFNNDNFKRWARAYQPAIYTNMEISNYIESWHNQLKATYLKRKQNRRVGRLIFILVNDVEEDYLQNIQRLMLKVGRMGPEERRRRARQIKADQINLECIPDMITESGTSGGYLVQLFNNVELQHKIIVMENEMKSCICNGFRNNNIACKQMYLLNRLHAGITPFKGKLRGLRICR